MALRRRTLEFGGGTRERLGNCNERLSGAAASGESAPGA
jgi:hypothetical protein